MIIKPDRKKLYTAFDWFRPLSANDLAWVDCPSVRRNSYLVVAGGL